MDDDTASKFLTMMVEIDRLGVPEPGLDAKVVATGGMAKGTVERVLREAIFKFQGFSLTTLLSQIDFAMHYPGLNGKLNALAFGTRFAIQSMMLGALTMSLKDIAQGKEPRSLKDPLYAVQAMMQGNMLGLGYLVNPIANQVQYGKPKTATDVLASVAPPAFKIVADAIATVGNSTIKIFDPEKRKEIALDLIKFLERNKPIDLPVKVIAQRLIYDQLEKLVNPDFAKDARAVAKRLKDQTGQEFFWQPGEATPDLKKLFGLSDTNPHNR